MRIEREKERKIERERERERPRNVYNNLRLSNSVCENEQLKTDHKKGRLERQQKMSTHKKYRYKNDGGQKRPQRL